MRGRPRPKSRSRSRSTNISLAAVVAYRPRRVVPHRKKGQTLTQGPLRSAGQRRGAKQNQRVRDGEKPLALAHSPRIAAAPPSPRLHRRSRRSDFVVSKESKCWRVSLCCCGGPRRGETIKGKVSCRPAALLSSRRGSRSLRPCGVQGRLSSRSENRAGRRVILARGRGNDGGPVRRRLRNSNGAARWLPALVYGLRCLLAPPYAPLNKHAACGWAKIS